MRSGVRVTSRATERKRRRGEHGAEPLPTSDGAASGSSGVQRGMPHIVPAPAPGVSSAAMAAAAGLRIVHEQYPGHPPADHGARSHDTQ